MGKRAQKNYAIKTFLFLFRLAQKGGGGGGQGNNLKRK